MGSTAAIILGAGAFVAAVSICLVLLAGRRSARAASGQVATEKRTMRPAETSTEETERFLDPQAAIGVLESNGQLTAFRCPDCNRLFPEGAAFCPRCGCEVASVPGGRAHMPERLDGDPPGTALALRVVAVLSVGGGLILCAVTWPRGTSEEASHVIPMAWLFSGIISGLLFFAAGEALTYMRDTREVTRMILSRLVAREAQGRHHPTRRGDM